MRKKAYFKFNNKIKHQDVEHHIVFDSMGTIGNTSRTVVLQFNQENVGAITIQIEEHNLKIKQGHNILSLIKGVKTPYMYRSEHGVMMLEAELLQMEHSNNSLEIIYKLYSNKEMVGMYHTSITYEEVLYE